MMNSDKYSITVMCKIFKISRASFYHYFFYSNDSKRNERKAKLLIRISQIYYENKRVYGAPRIRKLLCKEGYNISVKTVGKYMNLLGLKSIVSIKFPKKRTSLNDDEKSLIINRIKDLHIYRPNQVWTTDITYIKTKEDGFVYLSSIIDLYSRKVIAWNIDRNMKKELVIQTLNNAFKNRNYPIGVIIHSDKGTQYRSHAFRELVVNHNCLFSYTSLKHSCDENANQESFHASLKKEWLYHKEFNTLNDVKRAVFEYIEGFYNNKRIHSSLGYLSPIQFEFQHFNKIPLLPLSNLLT